MSLRRIVLVLAAVPALLVAAAWYWLLHTEPGAQWLWSKAGTATGGALSAASVSGDLGSGVTVRGLALDSEAVDLDLERISLTARLALLPLRVVVGGADAAGFSLQVRERGKDGGGDADLHGIFAKLRLPFEIFVEKLEIDGASFSGFAGAEFLSFDSAVIEGRWHDAIRVDRLRVRTPYYDADGAAQLTLHGRNAVAADVDLVAKPALTGLDDPLAVSAQASGSIDDLQLFATTTDPEATLQGNLRGLGGEAAWDLELHAPALRVPTGGAVADLPPAALAVIARGDWRSLVAEADVDFSGTGMRLGIAADVDMRSGAVSADVDWQEAHWPIGHPDPQVTSRAGKVTLGGSIDDWTVAGSVELEVPQLPPGRFTIDGAGNRDEARVEIIEGDIFGGTIKGRAEYSWREPQPFAASLELDGIKTGTVLPQWPAELSGGLAVTGQQQPLRFSATLRDLNGVFRDRPLAARGRIDYERDAIRVDNLELRHGEAEGRFDGELYAADGLAFELAVDDLAPYIDGAAGELRATGSVSLAADTQFLRVDASSELLGYRGLTVEELSVEDAGDPGSVISVRVSAARLTWGNVQVAELVLVPHIERSVQTIELDALLDGLQAGLSLRGSLDQWDRPSAWTGDVSRFDLHHEEFDARLQESAPFTLSPTRASVEELCLGGARDIRLCADAGWASGDGFDITAHMSSVPVDLVNALVDTRLEFDQVVSGEFSWRAAPDGKSAGRADLRMTAGTIASVDDPERKLATGDARLGFDVDGDDLRGGIVDVPLPGQGMVRAEFQVLDVAGTGAANLDGRADVDLADVGIVLPFLPVLDDIGGALRADIDVAGTLDAPAVTGNITLENGSLVYLPIGLRVDEIDLRSELQAHGDIELAGSFRAGEGRGQIRTRAGRADTLANGLEVTLRGRNLTLVDVPDVKAIANTEVQIGFDGDTLDIDGTLTVPRARIVPSNLATNRVYESEDVVIVAGELPDEPATVAKTHDIRIHGSLDVSLGKDVIVDLGVVETSVSGDTVLTWSGDPIPVANGRYDVAGEILAFGQRLEITEGSVQFPNVPANDPYLRIRAEREIFGNTQVRRAGVLVAGSLSRPTIEAYTTPLTTEERALTLLVTGSEFDYERGVGAVDFGTYVAPRVYASYGIGLFDNENVIRVRYDLKRGFGVTVTSGQKESGVDLSYRFEN